MISEHFRSLVESSMDAIITIDARGRVTGINPAAERLFGHTQHAATGRDLAELIIPPRYRARHREGLARLRETGIPRILDKHIELEAMRADGSEFPVELTVVRLSGSGERAAYAGFVRDITERVTAERAYRDLIDKAPIGIYRTNRQGILLSANPALAKILGAAAPDDIVGHSITEFYADPRERERLVERYGELEITNLDLQWKRKDGRPLRVALDIRVIREGAQVEYMGFVRDVTERLDLEQALHQAQKMDAVGRLAGGIAHDFNNILTAIIGYAEMMRAQLPDTHPSRGDAEEIRKAAARAAELTQQLLAFGRKQLLAPRVLDLGESVRSLEPMLKRLVAPAVTLETRIAPDLGRVEADPSRFDQVVVNLVVNARDAMGDGGVIRVGLDNLTLTAPQQVGLYSVPAGQWVVLSVADTGVGIEPVMLPHIFEPFFTTKENGQGTGLGLATVYGVVRQSGGYLSVETTPGKGATFRIYLPRVQAPADKPAPGPGPGARGRTGETIMVVEDEPAVRALLQRALGRAGFDVLAAGDPAQARELSASHPGRIDLLLTDVVMPGGGGRSLADELVKERPALKVIYMSGYTDDVIARQRVRDPDVAFLQKPFSAEQATRLIRDVLDKKP